MIKLYNTLGRKHEDFKPINQDEVTLYTCGPTVYSYYHVGNLRNAVFNDTLRRTLEASGYKVKHYNGNDGPYAKATDFINQQIELVKILLEKNYAYRAEEAIYFDVSKLSSYGELSGQKLSEKEVAVRDEVVRDVQKKNPQDFALWFFLVGRFKEHSMHWPSPWGNGFPGWHLECSAIVHATLGDPIDIHTGGVDHIGTHHPNEMAQTEAAFGHKLANFWVHNEHLLIEGQKMSKSLNNIFTLKDITQKSYEPLVLRLLFLQAHYRTQMNFTWESLTAAKYFLKNIQDNFSWVYQSGVIAKEPLSGLHESFESVKEKIKNALVDDLDTPKALSALAEASDSFAVTPASQLDVHTVEEFAKFILDTLGFPILDKARYDIPTDLKQLINQRNDARKNQDWQKADDLKSELQQRNLELLKDTDYGSIWYRK
jgi:cysteinyl-tRNA synthetase